MLQQPPNQTRLAARDPSIDTLRGLACLALVSYHVVGISSANGMELSQDHWLVLLNGTFTDMRMPLFSFLSGCVFISLERLTRSPGQMVRTKMRRLLLPMLTVGSLFWIAGTLMGQVQPPWVTLLYMPYSHFWFLQATFLIMAIFVLLHAVWPGRSTRLAAVLMGIAALIWVSEQRATPNIFSINQVAYLMPFFMLGYLCAHGTLLRSLKAYVSKRLAVLVLLALIMLGLVLMLRNVNSPDEAGHPLMTLLIGMPFCLSMLILAPRHRGLARIGGYSYTIYLFHVFFTAGSFELLQRLAPAMPDVAVWLAGMGAGVAGPVVLHHALTSHWTLATLFLGLKPRSRKPQGVAYSRRAQNA